MNKGLNIALSLTALLTLQTAALARSGGNWNITDGYGDGFVVHHGLFNLTEKKGVQDRLGDKYVKSRGLFGNSTEANAFGNKYVRKKNLIGGTSVGLQDMFGDSVESHKTWLGLGRRQTNVNLSGVGGLVQSFVGGRGRNSTIGQVDPNSPNAMTSNAANPADFAVDPAFNFAGGGAATGAPAAPADASSAPADAGNTIAPFSSR